MIFFITIHKLGFVPQKIICYLGYKPIGLHIIHKHQARLSSSALKVPEQHFLPVYPWRSGQPLHLETDKYSLAPATIHHSTIQPPMMEW